MDFCERVLGAYCTACRDLADDGEDEWREAAGTSGEQAQETGAGNGIEATMHSNTRTMAQTETQTQGQTGGGPPA